MENNIINLTHPQKRVLFNEIVCPYEEMSNVGFIFEFNIDISEKHIEQMLNSAIRKYDALRTRIVRDDSTEKIVQYFADYKEEEFDVIDCSAIEEIPKYLEKIHHTKFNFYNNKLYYFAILKLQDNKKGLYMKFHHIIVDGITVQLIVKDLSDQIEQHNLCTEIAPSYKEFIEYEKMYLKSDKYEKDREYWENSFKKLSSTTRLSEREDYSNHLIQKIYHVFPKNIFQRMTYFCENRGISYFHLLSAAIGIYFKKYKNESRISIGRAVHNRKKHYTRKMGGMFVSTVPFIYELCPDNSFNSLIDDIKLQIRRDMRHQEYPYDLMVESLRKYNKQMNNPINIQISETPEFNNEIISVREQLFSQKWNSEMIILINPRNKLKEEILEISINYLNPMLHENEVIKFLDDIESILWCCMEESTKPLNEIFKLNNEAEDYWNNAISKDFSKTTFFPTHQYKNDYQEEGLRVELPKHVFDKIIQYSKNKGLSVSDCMMSGIFLLMYKYTFDEEIIIGTPVQNGALTNILPIQMKLEDISYDSFGEKIKDQMEKLNKHGNYSIEQLMQKMEIQCSKEENPFFNIIFSSNNLSKKKLGQNNKGVDIDFEAHILENEISLDINYRNDIFTRERVERIWKRYIYILEQAMNNPSINIKDISILTDSEYDMITNEFLNVSKDWNCMDTVIDEFENRVLKSPQNIAVVEKDRRITYEELNKMINRLSHRLIELEIGKEDIVAVILDNSIEYIVSILAIMKAGGAALLIDPKNPQARIEGILQNSQAKGLIYFDKDITNINLHGFMMNIRSPEAYSTNEKNPPRLFGKENLAYIIYTSGSTGVPKGVCIEHHSLVNFCQWNKETYHISEKDRATKYASPGFDASIWEIFGFILTGACIYILPEEIKLNFLALNEFLEKNGITICFMPTRVFEEFLELENNSLRMLLTGGDKLRRFKKKRYKLVNNYGPTENTIVSTYCFLDDLEKGCIPIGKPVDNVYTWILDKNGNICPVDVVGELYLGGKAVARGYCNAEDLTAKSFVKHPLFPSQRLYRSGDLVRWLSDGNIEFIGRVDEQIQLRGLRIELGEIEAQMMTHPQIIDVSVKLQDKETDHEKICAYYTSTHQVDIQNFNEFLKDKLLPYMIPHYYRRLESLPFTNNGKINKEKLPYISTKEIITTEKRYPENDLEYELLDLWNRILENNSKNVTDDFFEIGGNSLLAAIMMSRIYEKYKINMPLDKFYNNPTIEGISRWMNTSNTSDGEKPFIIYNEEAKDNLFCFPSAFGNASEYFNLSKELSSFRIYAFNFIKDFTISDYVEEVLKAQEKGPYVFLGYSLGGGLAFEIAKEIKKLGHEVSKIIMIDSYAFDLKTSEQTELFKEDLKKNLEFDVTNIVDSITNIIRSIDFENKIDVPISNIRPDMSNNWKTSYVKGIPDILTSNEYYEYRGYGSHNEMLKEGFVNKNCRILSMLL